VLIGSAVNISPRENLAGMSKPNQPMSGKLVTFHHRSQGKVSSPIA
jgi:hypothetical protein